ncbi:hypothetical protein C8Q74DRAFT_577615 [Fomes fomentarius]|nr:hypothetical protein C8Q74DRAFT_577615 [Fomes fomentarius]
MPTSGPSSARLDPSPSRPHPERTTHAPHIPQLREATTLRHTLDAPVAAGRQLVKKIDNPPVDDSPTPQGIRNDAAALKTEEKIDHELVDEPPRYTFPPPPPPRSHAHVKDELYELCEYFVRNVGADLKPRP